MPLAQSQATDRTENFQSVKAQLGCPGFESAFYNDIYRPLLKDQLPPAKDEARALLARTLETERFHSLSEVQRARLLERLMDLYIALVVDAPLIEGVNLQDAKEMLGTLAGFEVGDRTSEEARVAMILIETAFSELRITASSLNGPGFRIDADCPVEKVFNKFYLSKETGLLGEWQKTRHPAVYGALKAFSTAYQSCEAAKIAALGAQTPDLQGIQIIGTHPDGIGRRRTIGDLSLLIRTHPYLKSHQTPATVCRDVLSTPLIYDYGGKPYASDDLTNSLTFFKNAGSGTEVLGVDCSGFIYTSLATAGLRLAKGKKLKAVGVYGVRARQWMDSVAGGLNCFSPATFSSQSSLEPGDVLASTGHVLMIESVGLDPLGILAANSDADCARIKMSIAHLDFTILHSGTAKNGLGIGRLLAKDYFSSEPAMADALLDFASQACLARIKNQTTTAKSASAGLVRHARTLDCLDEPVQLAGAECLSGCAADAWASSLLEWSDLANRDVTAERGDSKLSPRISRLSPRASTEICE